jgi:hypothetical protein
VVNGGDHSFLMGSQERTPKVDVVVQDANEEDIDELHCWSWPNVTEEEYDEIYRHLHAKYKGFEKHHYSSQHKIVGLEGKIKSLYIFPPGIGD